MYEYKINVHRVVDGDTIDGHIDLGFGIRVFKRIRLTGINAPETRTKNKVEKIKGIVAKDWLFVKLLNETVILKTEKDSTGKYGRVLGTLFVNDVNINELMLDEGLVEKYVDF